MAADAENIEVLDWNAHHPVLQSLRPLAALPLQRARILSPPAWSEVLLWSRNLEREFPLAFAGEHQGHRVACITFDLESERLLSSDTINLFLFFMNLLGWLAPRGDAVTTVRTGEVAAVADMPDGPMRLQDPNGRIEMLAAGQRTIQPRFAGEYQISVDGTRRALLANFFDPVESDIGRSGKEPPLPPHAVPAVAQNRQAAQTSDRQEYATWLYYAAAALFLLEWAAARRRHGMTPGLRFSYLLAHPQTLGVSLPHPAALLLLLCIPLLIALARKDFSRHRLALGLPAGGVRAAGADARGPGDQRAAAE